MPNDLPPWHAVYLQTRRWLDADVFTAIIADLRILIRVAKGRAAQPTAVILDIRTLPTAPKYGHRASYDGANRKKRTPG